VFSEPQVIDIEQKRTPPQVIDIEQKELQAR